MEVPKYLIILITLTLNGVKLSSVQYPFSQAQNIVNTGCGISKYMSGDIRIVGGETVDRDEFPWMAAIFFTIKNTPTHNYLCGGTIITNYHILTAAHCVYLYP